MRSAWTRLAAASAALLLAASAHVSRGDEAPGDTPAASGHELAHTLQQQRQRIAEAQALLADAGVGERGDAAAPDPVAGLDALEAALVEQGLLAPGAVQERGGVMSPLGAKLSAVAPSGAPSKLAQTSAVKAPAGSLKLGAIAQLKAFTAVTEQEIAAVARLIGNGAPPQIVEVRWKQAVQGAGKDTDTTAIVQQVLRQALEEAQRDLDFYVDEVNYHQELKKSIREEITRLRAAAAVASAPDRVRLEAMIADLQAQLASIADSTQLASVGLQQAVQKHQQVLHAMSSLSKKLQDTATAVINGMKG
jgi:hypothetical protein